MATFRIEEHTTTTRSARARVKIDFADNITADLLVDITAHTDAVGGLACPRVQLSGIPSLTREQWETFKHAVDEGFACFPP